MANFKSVAYVHDRCRSKYNEIIDFGQELSYQGGSNFHENNKCSCTPLLLMVSPLILVIVRGMGYGSTNVDDDDDDQFICLSLNKIIG